MGTIRPTCSDPLKTAPLTCPRQRNTLQLVLLTLTNTMAAPIYELCTALKQRNLRQ
jgi:hypothetical protein